MAKRNLRIGQIFLLCGLFIFALYCFTGHFMLSHVEQSYTKINEFSHRTEVKEKLNDFREIKKEMNLIPEAWQNLSIKEWIKTEKEYTSYQYIYYFQPFSFFIIYDEQDKVLMKIPTFE